MSALLYDISCRSNDKSGFETWFVHGYTDHPHEIKEWIISHKIEYDGSIHYSKLTQNYTVSIRFFNAANYALFKLKFC